MEASSAGRADPGLGAPPSKAGLPGFQQKPNRGQECSKLVAAILLLCVLRMRDERRGPVEAGLAKVLELRWGIVQQPMFPAKTVALECYPFLDALGVL